MSWSCSISMVTLLYVFLLALMSSDIQIIVYSLTEPVHLTTTRMTEHSSNWASWIQIISVLYEEAPLLALVVEMRCSCGCELLHILVN